MNMCLQLVVLFGLTLLSPSPVATVPVEAQGTLECQFPFIYKDVSYSNCTTKDDPGDKLWCSTKTDDQNNHINDKYKSCTPEDLQKLLECQFPFIYKDVSYSNCTTKDDGGEGPWCSTKTDDQNNHINDNYKNCTPEDLPTPLVATIRHSSFSPSECQFPFIYRNVKYSECITVGDPNEQPWCSTKTDSQHMHLKGNWMHCNTEQPEVTTESSVNTIPTEISKKCKFPFIYNNVKYTVCTVKNDPDDRLWCSTKTDNQNNHIIGNDDWKHCKSDDTQKLLQADDRQSTLPCWTSPDVKSGECILIQECPSLRSLLKQIQSGSAPLNGINTLRNSVCDKDGDAVRICCPLPENNQQRITENLVTTYSESQCGGAFNADKIVNGVNAELAQFPWMVIFRGRECINCRGTCDSTCPESVSTWNCGGVLISKRYVLSAAHCFKHFKMAFARIGEFDLSKNPDKSKDSTAPQPQDIDVKSVIIHSEYGSPFNGSPCPKCNDIALVKLARPVVMYTRFVYPICLPSNPVKDMGFSVSEYQHKVGHAAGWGATNKAGTIPANILQQANLTIQELDFCRERKVKHPAGSILCAGQGDGQDTCRGDSGGPLMIADSYGLKWYAVGITSYGATACGAKGFQGIFTNINYYMYWINKIIS